MIGLFATPSISRACSEAPNELNFNPSWSDAVASDGVLVFSVTLGGLSAQEVEAAVAVGIDELPDVGGTLSVFEDRADLYEAIAVWQPEAPLPQGSFTLRVTLESRELTYTIEVAADQLGPYTAVRPQLELVENSGTVAPVGRSLCCESTQDICGSSSSSTMCSPEAWRKLPGVFGSTGLPEEHLPHTITRVFEGVDGSADDLVLRVSPSGFGWEYQRALHEEASSYCTRFEHESLIDGSVIESEVVCVEHQDFDVPQEQVDLDEWSQSCDAQAYWEESGDPFAPGVGGCSIGGTRTTSVLALMLVLGLLRRRG